MTDTNEKIRSLFLTALMVFSVFAGTVALSGAAAAANTPGVSQATEYAGNGGSTQGTVEVVFNRSVSTTDGTNLETNVDVYLDETKVVENGGTNNAIAGNNFRIVNGPGSDTATSMEFEIERDAGSGYQDFDVSPNRNLTVVVNDVEDANNPDTETDLTTEVDTSSRTLASTTRVNAYRGEAIAITGSSNGAAIEVSEDDRDGGSLIVDDTLNSNSNVYVLDTDNLDTGVRYNVTIDGNDRKFRLNDLNLQAAAEDNSITDEDDLVANATARRGGQPATATLVNDDGDDVDSIVKNLQSNSRVDFNFGAQSADDGPYTVEVTDNQTGVTVETDQINVSEAEEGDASFGESVVSDERGDVANVTIQLDNTDNAVIFIGDEEEDNYAVQAEVEDDDGDGEVVVQFNSYTAGDTGSTVVSAAGDDDVVSSSQHGDFAGARGTLDEDDMLEAASYNMNVTAGSSPDFGDADSVGTLRLNDRSTESMQIWTAPAGTDITDEDISVYDRVGQNLTQSTEIAAGDVVVHQVSASGIEGVLDAQGASDTTSAFLAAQAEGEALNLTVNKTNVGANTDEKSLELNASNTDVVADSNNDTYFVAVDTSQLQYLDGTELRRNDNDDRLTANFSATEGALSEDGADSVEADFRAVDRDATINTDADGLVTVQAAADQEITGTTTVAPGTELTVRIDSESESNPFILRPETTVGPNGTFTATQDFSDQSAGVNFTAQTRRGGSNLGDEEDGRIVGASTATVSISDQESDGSEVVVDSAQLSDGGFVVIHDGSLLEGEVAGSVVGSSDYLEAGSHEDITITLDEPQDEDFTAIAMPHLDTNGNEAYDFPDADGPYTANGSAVTAAANVTVTAEEEPTETEAPDTETEAPDTETEAPDTDTEMPDTETEAPETTAEEGPGFTAAIALIALIAAALLAVRRDN